MSAQPTPSEGPYHPAMDKLSVKFGPDEFQVKFSSPETVGTECILMNMGFAQCQASSAKEVEVYRKALEDCIKKLNQLNQCSYGKYCKDEAGVCQFIEKQKAILTSKPEPVAQGHDGNCVPVRTPDDGWKCDCGYAPVAPAGKWGPALDKEKVLDWLESQVWSCRDTQEKAGWNDAVWTLNGLVRDGKFDLSPEAQDAMIRGGKRKPE